MSMSCKSIISNFEDSSFEQVLSCLLLLSSISAFYFKNGMNIPDFPKSVPVLLFPLIDLGVAFALYKLLFRPLDRFSYFLFPLELVTLFDMF